LGIGFRPEKLFAIGVLLLASTPADSQAPRSPVPVPNLPGVPYPGAPGLPPPAVPPIQPPAAPAAPGVSPAPPSVGAPTEAPTVPTPEEQTAQPTTTPSAEQQRLSQIRQTRRNRLERRGPYQGYVTPWSGPHVIEQTLDDASFLVEGSWVTTTVPCWGWVAGDRVRFVWRGPGACALYNRTRHRSCPARCETYAGWYKMPYFIPWVLVPSRY
jgi:hypothetical protein